MYKMVIGLNEEKIINDKNLEIETIYDKLDSIFGKRGFKLSIENDYRTYSGSGAAVDYPNLGIILNGLKKQDWFIKNLSVWLLCTNEDSDDPNDFEEEDLIEYFGLKVA